ncbi:hypothetical protein CDLVIII_4374 [Clostridium sp. DL-VIII]|uniref:hypothetical protein n=1 Tax=Clostridium sp. DL-VIII TaxID=641107 RepID=UPI00023B05B2|nr:hypothetical protein [Clostridium sp. DL-VIII]EHJ00886.1 hypothetical protein CDLVIII_4374 [Clostridium sp. DL-VIII]
MKKSIIAVGAGAFIVITSLLCMDPDGKMYQKQKHFDTVNDVLMQLENNKLEVVDKNGQLHMTNEFEECLSKRKRLTFSEIDFGKIEVEKIEELNDKEKNSITDDYNNLQERLALPYKAEKIEPVRLDIKGSRPKYDDYVPEPIEYSIDLVMVDEGEGLVIDYYVEHDNKSGKARKEGKGLANAED